MILMMLLLILMKVIPIAFIKKIYFDISCTSTINDLCFEQLCYDYNTQIIILNYDSI
jgi:hypothetical protein